MNSLRAFSSFIYCSRSHARIVSACYPPPRQNTGLRSSHPTCYSLFSSFSVDHLPRRPNSRRFLTRASNWDSDKSPYETLELERDADEEKIKIAYRRLVKFYHPDVYNGKGALGQGETAEARFIKIQAAYELLMDDDKRGKYDRDHRVNPLKASQAWMEWLMKKRRAFDQRGDMAVTAWAEQQQHELNIRVRRLSRSKMDPEEERRILAKEKAASVEYFNNTLKRHTLILKKRDLARRKMQEVEEKKKIIDQLLAAEGLELLDTDEDEDSLL